MTLHVAELEDQDLVSLAVGGNQTASSELVRRHRDWVYRLVRSQIGDPDESLDVTQAAFVAAFGALHRFDRSRPFRHWLARIALNKSKDWKRRSLVRRFLSAAAPLSEAENVADQAPGPDRLSSDQAELRRTLRAISELPTSLREPLVLRTIEEHSQAETANILGLSEKAVEARVYRARARLAEKIKKL